MSAQNDPIMNHHITQITPFKHITQITPFQLSFFPCSATPHLTQCDAGDLGDLHVYDPVAMAWTDLSTPAFGASPSPRGAHGFTAAGARLYVHGGANGECVRGCGDNDISLFVYKKWRMEPSSRNFTSQEQDDTESGIDKNDSTEYILSFFTERVLIDFMDVQPRQHLFLRLLQKISSTTCTSTKPSQLPGRTSPPPRPAPRHLPDTGTVSRRRGASSTCMGGREMTRVNTVKFFLVVVTMCACVLGGKLRHWPVWRPRWSFPGKCCDATFFLLGSNIGNGVINRGTLSFFCVVLINKSNQYKVPRFITPLLILEPNHDIPIGCSCQQHKLFKVYFLRLPCQHKTASYFFEVTVPLYHHRHHHHHHHHHHHYY